MQRAKEIKHKDELEEKQKLIDKEMQWVLDDKLHNTNLSAYPSVSFHECTVAR